MCSCARGVIMCGWQKPFITLKWGLRKNNRTAIRHCFDTSVVCWFDMSVMAHINNKTKERESYTQEYRVNITSPPTILNFWEDINTMRLHCRGLPGSLTKCELYRRVGFVEVRFQSYTKKNLYSIISSINFTYQII